MGATAISPYLPPSPPISHDLTGQVLEMGAIAAHVRSLNAAAQARGAPAVPFGLDLAHAVGK